MSWSVGRHPASHNVCLQLTWAWNCAKLFSIQCNSGLHHKKKITHILLLLVQTSLNVCYVCCWYIVLNTVCICPTQRMIILQQATDYYLFNICCIESLQCISCVIKFNSGRKHSNYIYRTTPLFLSTHQKISTKNDL